MEVDRHTFRTWLVGVYCEYAFDKLEDALIVENAKKAKKFSHEVLRFMDMHERSALF